MKFQIRMVAILLSLILAASAYASNWDVLGVSLCSSGQAGGICPTPTPSPTPSPTPTGATPSPTPVPTTTPPGPTPSATPTPPVNPTGVERTLDFINTIGATSKIITALDSPQQVINAANYTGIKHLRDDATVFYGANQFGGNLGLVCSVAQATGAQFIVLPVAFEDPNNIVINQSNYEFLKSCGALDSVIEGQNELNNSNITYHGINCPGSGSYFECEQFQADLYNMIKTSNPNSMCTGPGTTLASTDFGGSVACCTGQGTGTCPSINNEVVYGNSEVGAESDNVGLQFNTIPAANATGNGNETTNVPLNCCSANGSGGTGTIVPGTKLADVGNYHNYFQGNGQSGVTPIDNQTRYAGTVNRTGPYAGDWDLWGETLGGTATGSSSNLPVCAHGNPNLVGCDGGTWRNNFPVGDILQNGVPKTTTETSWTIFKGGNAAVTLAVTGKMTVNDFLDQLQLGFQRTYIYLLINDPCDGGYGFFQPIATAAQPAGCSNQGWTSDEMDATNATPLGLYTHNLFTILADTTANFTPTVPSGLSISGLTVPSPNNNDSTNYPSMYYSQLMEKSNGTYELILWGESYASQQTIHPVITLGSTYATVNTYDITLGTTPTATSSNTSSVSVSLIDHPIIVEFHN